MRNRFLFSVLLLPLFLLSTDIYSQTRRSCDDNNKPSSVTTRKIQKRNGVIIIEREAVPSVPRVSVLVPPAIPGNPRPAFARVPRPSSPERNIPRTYRRIDLPAIRQNSGYEYSFEERRFETARTGNIAQVARLNGYRDGQREGAKDARDGDAYNPFGEHAYRDGATGYISKYGDRQFYQQIYRQSFVRGYRESFGRYLGYDSLDSNSRRY